MSTRRTFLKKTGLAVSAIPLMQSHAFKNPHKKINSKHPICYFSKHLQWLGYDDLGMVLKEAGFDGADLTVRAGGHIDPGGAVSELPKAVQALQQNKISIPMVVTRISDPMKKGVNELLKVLADNGVQYYRMGYLTYDYNTSMERNIEQFHMTLSLLADMNSKYNICGVYQNHAGNRLGASIWDLLLTLKDINPDHLGCQFDVRHATFEGGRSWENDFRAIKDHVRTTVVKDFHWIEKEDGSWTNNNTLMGEGMVDFNKYFQLYHDFNIEGPISNHSEYPLITEEERNLSKVEKMNIAISRLRQDVAYTRKFLD